MLILADYEISFSTDVLIIFLGIFFLAGYSFYIYKYTIPKVSTLFKVFLLIVRAVTIILIFILIFEPLIIIKNIEEETPINLVFVDNSKSITVHDSIGTVSKMFSIINDLDALPGKNELISFGAEQKMLKENNLTGFNFLDPLTNFYSIIDFVNNDTRNIASVIIFSDGIITDGINPVYKAEELNVPLYTIGTGDTTLKKDVAIKKNLYNEFIYSGNQTTIRTTIINTGFEGQNLLVALNENNKLIDRKQISLNESGINTLDFDYTPKEPGDKKITINVSQLTEEENTENNTSIFFLNVLNNKQKILLVTGSPSSDFTFIKNSLESNENLQVESIVQTSDNKYFKEMNRQAIIDSADILFLIGFPSRNTSIELLNQIIQKIKDKTPFFLSLSPGIDLGQLKTLEIELPFKITTINTGKTLVQPEIIDEINPILINNAQNPVTAWNNLPPVLKSNSKLTAKPESKIISNLKIRNIVVDQPLILTRKLSYSRSIAVLGENIWKWKLQISDKNIGLFDNFISQSVKWLSSKSEYKQVSIKTTKRIYSIGEPIEFIAKVYDETFDPLENADVKIEVMNEKNKFSVEASSRGNSIYEGELDISYAGDYNFAGTAFLNNNLVGRDEGKFTVGEVEVEMLNLKQNTELLRLLANSTGGKFYFVNDVLDLNDQISSRIEQSKKEKTVTTEIELWSNEWILAFIILLFSLEWFFRKRSGML